MADRVDFYFRQRVTEAELDLACELLEQADRDLASDVGLFGIVTGAIPAKHQPVPDLSVDLSSPTRAYDRLGRRVAFGTDQTVDCSVDLVGIPTSVNSAGNERWLGVFLRFERQLSDPRTDGNAQQVYFRRDESFELVVRQAPEAPIGSASKVALQQDELLVCDLRLVHGQAQILDEDLELSRRQAFIFAEADSIAVVRGAWSTLQPLLGTVQSSLDEVDAELSAHFSGVGRRHPASDVDLAPHSFLSSNTVQAALHELLDRLTSTAVDDPGAKRIGADAVVGTPHALSPSTIDHQLSQLLGWLNQHLGALTGAHKASSIAAQPHNHLSATNVQAQLQELVASLSATVAARGASLIGSAELAGEPRSLGANTVQGQLSALLALLNSHLIGGDHDGRYYNVGEQVEDADTLDGQHASDFALAGHDHDERYMRRTFLNSSVFAVNQVKLVTMLTERPDLITVSYNYLSDGVPQATTYVRGTLSGDIRAWVTKRSAGGDKDYEVTVQNLTGNELYISVAAYRVGL